MRSAVAFSQVSYSYPESSEAALREVTLELDQGELCLLAGRSGQGKSTLLRAACGLVPHFHGGTFAGSVSVAGMDTREYPPARLGAHVGVLQGDSETQLVMSSVRAELALAMESRGHGATAVARAVEEVALALGIDHLIERSTHDLSGGEKQRVALGAALVGRPRVVLLDEPTSQLDPVAGDELIGLLRRLNQEWDTTILLSEHRLERCLSAADRVIALEDGAVVHDGSPSSFLYFAAEHEPSLQTPGAKLFALAGIGPPPVGVKQARASLRREGMLPDEPDPHAPMASHTDPRGRVAGERIAGPEVHADGPLGRQTGLRKRIVGRGAAGVSGAAPAFRLRGVWCEIPRGPAILRGVDLAIVSGERVALMGRNGAGKSTLLRHAAGLVAPTRGKIERSGRVALLLQNPNDYFLHERVRDELSPEALRRAGLGTLAERNPRDLSGGERQRLALAIVADGGETPVVVALDEPTRGMDREAKAQLAEELHRRAGEGQAVIVATHDPEFAASCAQRAILLADGRVIADGQAADLLAGGWYFATETARILGGAGGALRPEEGAELLRGLRAGKAGSLPDGAEAHQGGDVQRARGSQMGTNKQSQEAAKLLIHAAGEAHT
ncbi:MAG TPA: ATP-binding cassette domain-containing protein [Solirubrobacteraceae bacterium]|nr:ATP-binding cassette domain-containing protein [Solirubrobacteraceae bacterium]